MAKHVSYRGVTIDMDSMRRENERSPAIGNMPVNARGDIIKGSSIIKPADQLAREQHKIKSAIMTGSLKGPVPSAVNETLPTTSTPIEVELPSGDIIIEGEGA